MLFEKRQHQYGEGIVSDTRNMFRKAVCPKETRPLFAGEKHAPCANYSGPGTAVAARVKRGDKPVNYTDAVAQKHDINYHNLEQDYRTGRIGKPKALSLARAADQQMVAQLKAAPKGKGSFYNRAENALTKQIISSKMKLEDAGTLDPEKFALPQKKSGKKKYPADKLRKVAKRMTTKSMPHKAAVPNLEKLAAEIMSKLK